MTGIPLRSICFVPLRCITSARTRQFQCRIEDCADLEHDYGGPSFIYDDPSTHWTEPQQLYTWWKNNVERHWKYQILRRDCSYHGSDSRKLSRARWCRQVVILSDIIRNSLANVNKAQSTEANIGMIIFAYNQH